MKLIHPFVYNCHIISSKTGLISGIEDALNGTHKLSSYLNKLEQQSIMFPNRYNSNKYKGDGFELLIEALIKLSPIDNRIGIYDYEPIINNDTGVDGVGIGIDLKPATVQVKYRANHDNVLTANEDHLSNFVSTSLLKYKVDPSTKTNMLIVTSAKGLHHYTDYEMFQNQVRCIGYDDLRSIIDNNLIFWKEFKNLVINSK